MLTAELRFKINKEGDLEGQDDAVNSLLGRLRHNGQILGREFPFAFTGSSIRAFVLLPALDALAASHHNKYVKNALLALSNVGLAQPVVRVLDKEITEKLEDKPAFYILYTSYLTIESPLRSGTTFAPIPLYMIPPTNDESEYYSVMNWQSNYQACDTLWMNSIVGADFGRRQMSDVSSDLSTQGRELCDQVTLLTDLPTFYYLYRYLQRTTWRKEVQRKCPGCNGNWLLPEPWHIFDFKCDACRLVSSVSRGTY